VAFYVGKYLISEDTLSPKHDRDSWAFPADSDQHMSDTSNVEDLYINVKDMDVLPTQIQFGADEYTADEGFIPDHKAFDQFYVRDEKFYVRGFTAGSELYSQFYVRDEAFYVRGFTAGSELYSQFYVRAENFYVRSFQRAPDLYTTFYVRDENFYVRSFTPRSGFYVQAEESC